MFNADMLFKKSKFFIITNIYANTLQFDSLIILL